MAFAAEWQKKAGEKLLMPDGKKAGKEFLFNLMVAKAVLILLNIYQKYIRSILLVSCRFSPSCSEYTKQAINKYGAVQGIFKGFKRIMRCHPLSKCRGYDPLT